MTGQRITATSPADSPAIRTAAKRDLVRLAAWITFAAAYALIVAVLASPEGITGSSSKALTNPPAISGSSDTRTDGGLTRKLVLAAFAAGSQHERPH